MSDTVIATWKGERITDLSREELIEIIHEMGQELERKRCQLAVSRVGLDNCQYPREAFIPAIDKLSL